MFQRFLGSQTVRLCTNRSDVADDKSMASRGRGSMRSERRASDSVLAAPLNRATVPHKSQSDSIHDRARTKGKGKTDSSSSITTSTGSGKELMSREATSRSRVSAGT